MNKSSIILAFLTGAALGSAVTWKIVKTKYDQITRDEIKTMKEYYSKKYSTEESNETETQASDLEVYEDKLTGLGYASQEEIEEKKGVTKSMRDEPYVIEPDEFGDIEEYETISLTYYADKILADEDNEPIHDIDELIGYESLNHFGEYEDDSVFVRNDKLRTDYEILLDERKYAESKRRPYNPQVDD